jgi:sugar O-acyltransferase, sialic acid O-acetyltransferase NeuD family
MKKLAIIGAGGHGQVVKEIAEAGNKYNEIVFFDDDFEKIRNTLVMGTIEESFYVLSEYDVFVAIGNNSIRKTFLEKLEQRNAVIPLIIHPNASVSKTARIGKGTVVMENVVIHANAVIGNGCIINTGSIIEHDNDIKDYAHVSPGALLGGTVKIGEGTHVGIGAVVRNNIEICESCMIGAGAVVVNSINVPGVYVGIPARLL